MAGGRTHAAPACSLVPKGSQPTRPGPPGAALHALRRPPARPPAGAGGRASRPKHLTCRHARRPARPRRRTCTCARPPARGATCTSGCPAPSCAPGSPSGPRRSAWGSRSTARPGKAAGTSPAPSPGGRLWRRFWTGPLVGPLGCLYGSCTFEPRRGRLASLRPAQRLGQPIGPRVRGPAPPWRQQAPSKSPPDAAAASPPALLRPGASRSGRIKRGLQAGAVGDLLGCRIAAIRLAATGVLDALLKRPSSPGAPPPRRLRLDQEGQQCGGPGAVEAAEGASEDGSGSDADGSGGGSDEQDGRSDSGSGETTSSAPEDGNGGDSNGGGGGSGLAAPAAGKRQGAVWRERRDEAGRPVLEGGVSARGAPPVLGALGALLAFKRRSWRPNVCHDAFSLAYAAGSCKRLNLRPRRRSSPLSLLPPPPPPLRAGRPRPLRQAGPSFCRSPPFKRGSRAGSCPSTSASLFGSTARPRCPASPAG
jgi:hypothetical protein